MVRPFRAAFTSTRAPLSTRPRMAFARECFGGAALFTVLVSSAASPASAVAPPTSAAMQRPTPTPTLSATPTSATMIAAEQRPPTATTAAKQEGDGRGPAGVFAIGRVLGKDHAPKSGLPSAVSNIDDVCVDDVSHPAYNRIGRKNALPPSRSAEQMVAGAGSCVFLHVWRAADKGTAGCTAMARDALDDVVAWLDEKRHPLLVQLPADVYAAAPTALGLPAL